MSAVLVQTFFPSIASLVRTHPSIHRVWLKLFPATIEQLCPRPKISLLVFEEHSLTLMWPYASIFCLLGIILGFVHAAVLLPNAFTNGARRGSFTWGFAFLWYGVMSVGGLYYHCLASNGTFYLLDVVATACSSISVAAGCLVFTGTDDREPGWRRFLALCYVVIVILALKGPQIVRDLLYLVPAVAALLIGIWFVGRASKGRSGRALGWLCGAILGAIVALGGLLLDAWLCRNFGSNWSLLLWFFMGCDASICCLYQFVRTAVTEEMIDRASFKYKES